MKTIAKIIYSVKEAVTNFNVVDDNRIDDEYLIDLANTIRSTLIDEEFRASRLSEDYYQRDCCIEIECVKDTCTIEGISVSSNNPLYFANLNGLKKGIGWDNIKYVGTQDVEFSRLSYTGYLTINNAPFGGAKPAYTLIGNTIYFKNMPTSGQRFVCVIAIYEDPTEVGLCDRDKEEEIEYPVPNVFKLEYLMKKSILESYNIPVDEINDTRDGTIIKR